MRLWGQTTIHSLNEQHPLDNGQVPHVPVECHGQEEQVGVLLYHSLLPHCQPHPLRLPWTGRDKHQQLWSPGAAEPA